ADIVSLTGENRIIVSEGLRNIKNLGLKVLIETAGKEVQRISTSDISFVIAPIINACGRIGNPKLGVELLLTEDVTLARRMAKKLYTLNQDRQNQCKQATEESIRIVEQSIRLDKARVIAVCGDDWHSGIIGIVASKLVELYRRPAIVLTRADGQLKGSARSVSGVSIYNILNNVKHHLLRFGGHDLAAGLTLEESAFEDFNRDLQIAAAEYLDDRYVAERRCDYLVTPDVITMKFISDLERIQPCGLDNHEPIFEMRNLHLASFSRVGSDQQHARVTVKAGMGTFDGIAFGMVDSFEGIRSGDDMSILFSPEISTFRGAESISLKIKDVHSGSAIFHRDLKRAMDMQMANFIINQQKFCFTSIPSFDKIKELNKVNVFTYEDMKKLQKWIYDNHVEHEILFGDEEFEDDTLLEVRFLPTVEGGDEVSGVAFLDYIPQREDVVKVFRYCKKSSQDRIDTISATLRMNVPKVIVSFALLHEIGILEYEITNNYVNLMWKNPPTNKKLEETELFQKIQRETGIGGLDG
ncbi:MAG: DHHA1 domain-containing protein, partial [Bacillota bacterium]|nr:DHHA1 domain-containing protein [Bacillota bacterium]